jgi:hypothetical protein
MTSKFPYLSASALRRNDSGFALPIAIGVGLFLIIVAAATILRSQQQQVTAITQKQTASSLSAAEVGVSRIQSLLTRYRAASLYAACASTSGSTCDAGTSASPTWKNASDIPGLSTSCPKDAPATPISKVEDAATKDWQPIDAADASKGQYRLVSYSYDNPTDPGKPNGQGTLKVQGRAGVANGTLSAVTQLNVTIPVQTISSYVPGLWVKNSVNTGTFNANILGPCTGTINAAFGTGFGVARSDFPMPKALDLPASGVNDLGSSIPVDTVLPRTGDMKSGTGIYQYVVQDINTSFKVTPGEKVEIWVKGDIRLQDGQKIQHQCGTVSGCSPFDAKIYGLSSPSGTLDLSGNAAVCDIFFHAPTYDVKHTIELTDSVKAEGCGSGLNNNGIYWVNSWSGGGQGVQVALDQTTAIWSSQSVLQPLIALKSMTGWQREEAESF